MASTHGVLSPPLHSDALSLSSMRSTKRKHEDTTTDIPNTNGTAVWKDIGSDRSKSLVRDLIDVLKEYDTAPSVLEQPIPERPSLSGPQAKRQKSNDIDVQKSILTRLSEDTYNNVEEVIEDIALSISAIMDSLQLPTGNVRLSTHQSTVSTKIRAFQQKAHELVEREKTLEENSHIVPTGAMSPKYMANGSGGAGTFTQLKAGARDDTMVLTLYGGASGPKQMFSSLQISGEDTSPQRDIVQILRELGLPNGISATQIVSSDEPGNASDKKRVLTLGDMFPTPPTVPALLPPKPSKTATTRSGTVGFYQPSVSEPLARSASYSRQSITSGSWIDYSNNSTSPQGTKRKRDRALSLAGAKAPSEPELVESEASKLDALFRSAYSGFAPTIDDGAAIAPSGVLNRIWWQKVGDENFEKMVKSTLADTASNEHESESEAVHMSQSFSDLQLKDFEKMIAEIENDAIDPALVSLQSSSEKSAEEKDVEEILQGISELLETLNSYQRIRHMSLSSLSRPAGLSAPDTPSLGTPIKPSDSEQATYEILKSQLSLMISSLPPYAVAKLDANRLADLNISTKIEVQPNNYNGVMEEDEAASRAKVAALSASSAASRIAPPAATPHRASSTSLYGNQYAASRTSSVPAAQYYPNTQTPVRPPSSSLQRPPTTTPISAYQSQRPAVPTPVPTSYRPNPAYGTPAAPYSHQPPRALAQSYGTSAQLYMPNSTGHASYMQPPNQAYQQGSQAPLGGQMNTRYSNSPAYPHQNSSQPNNAQFRYGSGPAFPRQASPQNPVYNAQTNPAPAQVRGGYSIAGTPAGAQGRAYIQAPMGSQQPMHGNGSQSPAPQYPASSGYGGLNYATVMTQQEQSNLMDRQRSVLAAHQQQTQQSARNAAMGGAGSGQVNGNGTNPVAAGL